MVIDDNLLVSSVLGIMACLGAMIWGGLRWLANRFNLRIDKNQADIAEIKHNCAMKDDLIVLKEDLHQDINDISQRTELDTQRLDNAIAKLDVKIDRHYETMANQMQINQSQLLNLIVNDRNE